MDNTFTWILIGILIVFIVLLWNNNDNRESLKYSKQNLRVNFDVEIPKGKKFYGKPNIRIRDDGGKLNQKYLNNIGSMKQFKDLTIPKPMIKNILERDDTENIFEYRLGGMIIFSHDFDDISLDRLASLTFVYDSSTIKLCKTYINDKGSIETTCGQPHLNN